MSHLVPKDKTRTKEQCESEENFRKGLSHVELSKNGMKRGSDVLLTEYIQAEVECFVVKTSMTWVTG